MPQKRTKKGVLFSATSLLLLGIMPIISNSRPMTIDALSFALYLSAWQFLIALPVCLLELKFRSAGIFNATLSAAAIQRTIVIILVTGAMFGISTYAYVLSVEKAGAVSASIAMTAYPLFAILWESLFLNRKKSLTELLFTGLLLMGLYYLGTNGSWKIKGLSYWFLFALTVPLIWSIAHVILKEMLDKTPITPVQITFFRALMSTLILLIISLSVNGPDNGLSLLADTHFQSYAMAMGLVYYSELIVWFYAVKNIDVSVASSITTPWPVVTLFLAIIFLNETVRDYQMITLAVTLISVYGLIWAGKKKQSGCRPEH
ncbi:DMT family transporter [Amphritea sp.]|uniref:DMT family transporter n=1 Tax=Amphritea sp. TaxID=1872502 RepID=UPI003D0CE71C